MTGLSPSYSLIRGPQFERTLKAYLKGLAKRDKEAALELFGAVLQELTVSPRQMRGQAMAGLEKMEPEPWPGGTLAGARRMVYSLEGWEFWKAYLNFPYARGAAQKGRIMYAIEEAACQIHLLMMYTHAEYSGRPDDTFLEGVMRESDVPPRT
ncbi:hypothetical protein [Deinococcus arcticus]|nr:hypothetical protein [Deinococcus arcticus]